MVLTLILLAQETELEYKAERLEGFKSSRGEGRKLFDNVEMWQDSLLIKCDFSTYYFKEKLAELEGNVRIYQNELEVRSEKMTYFGKTGISKSNRDIKIINGKTTLTAGSGYYYKNENKADFQKHVIIEDDSTKIYAERIIYFENNEDSFAYDSVLLKAKFENIYLQSDTVNNYPNLNKTFAKGKPILFKIDSSGTEEINYDTTTISSDEMLAFRDKDLNRYEFSNNVEIVKDDVKAKSDLCIFFKNENKIILSKNPGVFLDKTQLYADSIEIYLAENKLHMIKAFNNAINLMYEDTLLAERKNQIKGDSIIVSFKNDQIQKLESYSNAKMLYFIFSENGPDGVNRASSQKIEIFFTDNEPDSLIIHKDQNGETPIGDIFPENVIQKNINEYFFKEYQWLDTLPVKKYLDNSKINLN